MKKISKAIAGVIGSVAVSMGTAMADGDLTQPEIMVALGAGLVVGGGIVYVAPKNAVA
jgi:predicted phage tail protein